MIKPITTAGSSGSRPDAVLRLFVSRWRVLFHFLVAAAALYGTICQASGHQGARLYLAASYTHNIQLHDLTPEQEHIFRGVGNLQCDLGGRKGYPSTAFLLGSNRIVITAAHGFLDPRVKKLVTPDKCHFVTYSGDGRASEVIPIAAVRSRWDDKNTFGNMNEDVAIATLAYAPKQGAQMFPVEYGHGNPGKVMIVECNEKAEHGHRRQIGFGQIYRKEGRIALPQYANLAVHDVPTAGISSGSPVFAASGAVIGVHHGFIRTQEVTNAGEFDPKTNFNLAFIFDERFRKDLREMVEAANTGITRPHHP